MIRSTEPGRNSTAIINTVFTPHIASRTSAAISAILLLPAFCASCEALQQEPVKIILQATKVQRALDVYFFDATAPCLLDSYQQILPGDTLSYALSCQGEKRIALLSATAGDLYSRAWVTCYDDLKRVSFRLEDDSPQEPMVYAVADIDAGASRSVELSLKPLLIAIRVKSVSCDFVDSRMFHNDKFYLVNAVSESCPLDGGRPVSWSNFGREESEIPFLSGAGLGDIGKERIYPADAVLYTYPNPGGSPPTRLVLEGTVGDIRCYYPVTLTGLEAGKEYSLDITIKRMGTDDPDTTAVPGTYYIDYITEPWHETASSVETF